MAVRCSLRHASRTDVAARTSLIFDHHPLAPRLREARAQVTRHDVAAVPMENGTITRTGRSGKPCALASAGHSAMPRAIRIAYWILHVM
jgi:hypothetical protein